MPTAYELYNFVHRHRFNWWNPLPTLKQKEREREREKEREILVRRALLSQNPFQRGRIGNPRYFNQASKVILQVLISLNRLVKCIQRIQEWGWSLNSLLENVPRGMRVRGRILILGKLVFIGRWQIPSLSNLFLTSRSLIV